MQVNAATVRTITRTYGWANGTRTLLQVIEEEKQGLPRDESKVVRATSSPDVNGNLQLVQREIEETKKTANDAEETKTTVMRPSVNGGLTPAMQVQERRTRGANDTVESKKTTLFPDGSGNWQVSETRQATTRQEGKSSSSEERVSRVDSDGKLHVDPPGKDPHTKPHHQRKLQTSGDSAQQIKANGLRDDCIKRAGHHAKSAGLQNIVDRQIFLALIRQDTENHGSPKAVTGKLIRIPVVVRVLVMQAVPIHPRDRIDINPKSIVNDSDRFDEPFLVVEGAMSDSQMKDIGQVQPGQKPTKEKIRSANEHSSPRT